MGIERVEFLTNGIDTPSSRFRVCQFLEQVTDEFRYNVSPSDFVSGALHSPVLNGISAANIARNILVEGLRGSRFFIQRMLLYRNNIALERLLFSVAKNGVVIDFDDAIFLDNPRFSRSIARADLVIAGNDYLANWASSYTSRVKVIPTCVDHLRYAKERSFSGRGDGRITVGWTGTKGNLHYLEPIAKPLSVLQKKYKFRMLLISDADVTPEFLSSVYVEHLRWNRTREIEQLGQIDIGLMPLPDNEWARGKCGFKLLQYMATGALALGSAIGANLDIIGNGDNGFLCDSPQDWHSKIEWALRNFGSSEYAEVLDRARTNVESRYSVKANYDSFVEAVEFLE